MGQNGQEPIKQPGVGVGLADAEGNFKFSILDVGRIYMLYHKSVICFSLNINIHF